MKLAKSSRSAYPCVDRTCSGLSVPSEDAKASSRGAGARSEDSKPSSRGAGARSEDSKASSRVASARSWDLKPSSQERELDQRVKIFMHRLKVRMGPGTTFPVGTEIPEFGQFPPVLTVRPLQIGAPHGGAPILGAPQCKCITTQLAHMVGIFIFQSTCNISISSACCSASSACCSVFWA